MAADEGKKVWKSNGGQTRKIGGDEEERHGWMWEHWKGAQSKRMWKR